MKNILFSLALLLTVFSSHSLAGKAPDFQARDHQNKVVQLKDHLGKGPVIVNFWATWCVPCLKEMVKIRKMMPQLKDLNVQVLAVSIDDNKTKAKVPAVVRQKRLKDFVIIMDPDKEIYNKFQVSDVPEVFLLDSAGNIVYHHKGFRSGDEKKLLQKIQELTKG